MYDPASISQSPDQANALVPQGSFAESSLMNPENQTVADLNSILSANNIGVVAHFYIDAELQGVLSQCQWPRIYVADSLLMADHAVKMAEAGVSMSSSVWISCRKM